jgi:hypothetical protein
MESITFIGLLLIFLYALSQILSFYGVSKSTYGIYISFYLLLSLFMVTLPTNEPTID